MVRGQENMRMVKGSLLEIDLRTPEQITADNAPYTDKTTEKTTEKTTAGLLESIPIIGPVIEGIISVTKGRISLFSYEMRNDGK